MSQAFLDQSRAYLLDEYVPKIVVAVSALAEPDIWWRPAAGSNSVGNLILHIEGNARQWLIGGVGQRTNARDRDAEFAAEHGPDRATLLGLLTTTFREIDGVLASVPVAALDEPRRIQGAETTVFHAIYHVVEHVSMHTGQIIQIAKWRAPGAVRLYDATSESFAPLWSPTPRT